MAPMAAELPAGVVADTSPLGGTLVEVRSHKRALGVVGWLAVGWLTLVLGCAFLAPILPIRDPTASLFDARQAPSWHLLFGSDDLGRDVLSRVVWGTQGSLCVSVGGALIGVVIGGGLGIAAGYWRGRVERLVGATFDTMLAVPPLVLALALVAVLATGPGTSGLRRLTVLTLAFGWVSVPYVGRIVRASALSWADQGFVRAAQAMGARERSIVAREVLPNVAASGLSASLFLVAHLIIVEGGLSILGAGVRLPTPSWGNIIAEGHDAFELGAPHIILVPVACVFLTALSLFHLGDRLRQRGSAARERAL
jgi:peptide/nickel transport system permease protein